MTPRMSLVALACVLSLATAAVESDCSPTASAALDASASGFTGTPDQFRAVISVPNKFSNVAVSFSQPQDASELNQATSSTPKDSCTTNWAVEATWGDLVRGSAVRSVSNDGQYTTYMGVAHMTAEEATAVIRGRSITKTVSQDFSFAVRFQTRVGTEPLLLEVVPIDDIVAESM